MHKCFLHRVLILAIAPVSTLYLHIRALRLMIAMHFVYKLIDSCVLFATASQLKGRRRWIVGLLTMCVHGCAL